MHLEHRQIIRRCLDHDFPSRGILSSRVPMRAMLFVEDSLDPIQVQRRAVQADAINPTLTESAQAPCRLFFRQGVCDLGQAGCVAYRSEAVLVFRKFDSRLVAPAPPR